MNPVVKFNPIFLGFLLFTEEEELCTYFPKLNKSVLAKRKKKPSSSAANKKQKYDK